MVVGSKASSSSTPEMVGGMLLLLACETSDWQIVVAGGVVHPLAVEARVDSIPKMVGCVLLLLAGKVSSKLLCRDARSAAVASPRWWGACCFSPPVRQASVELWWWEGWCAPWPLRPALVVSPRWRRVRAIFS